jgi:hypothetical protein
MNQETLTMSSHARAAALCALLSLSPLALGCGDDDALFDDGGGSGGQGASASGGSGGDAAGGATGGDGTGGQSTGGQGNGGQSTGGQGGGGTCFALGDACTECELANCPTEYCDCFQNDACVSLAQCAITCIPGDLDCYQPCWTASPNGISDAALLTHCAGTVCAASCPGFAPLDPCQQCLYSSCDAEMNACMSNPDCTALLLCLDACTAPGCENQCYNAHPGGLADAGPVGTCLQSSCAAPCG